MYCCQNSIPAIKNYHRLTKKFIKYFAYTLSSLSSINSHLTKYIFQVHLSAAFPLKCPEPAQWSLRARSHCPDPSKYFCLKNDLINGYSENCTVSDFLQPGKLLLL